MRANQYICIFSQFSEFRIQNMHSTLYVYFQSIFRNILPPRHAHNFLEFRKRIYYSCAHACELCISLFSRALALVGHLPSWPVRDAERATVDRLRANARTPSTAQSTQQADLLSTTAASRPLAVEAQGPLHLPPRGAAPSDRAGTRQASVPEVGDRRPVHRCRGTSMTGGRLLEMRGAADVSQRRRSQAVLHLSARGAAPSDRAGTRQASVPEVGDRRPAHS